MALRIIREPIVEKILKELKQFKLDDSERVCPYKDINNCSASLSSMVIDTRIKENYCDNENYDTCPIFLSKMLRVNSFKSKR
jgi:hypothetical protein